jgi:hypothetical protein
LTTASGADERYELMDGDDVDFFSERENQPYVLG